jgi:hypothetical protein
LQVFGAVEWPLTPVLQKQYKEGERCLVAVFGAPEVEGIQVKQLSNERLVVNKRVRVSGAGGK